MECGDGESAATFLSRIDSLPAAEADTGYDTDRSNGGDEIVDETTGNITACESMSPRSSAFHSPRGRGWSRVGFDVDDFDFGLGHEEEQGYEACRNYAILSHNTNISPLLVQAPHDISGSALFVRKE